ncbi:isopenicillin N synthase family oxygenase [Pseudaestuariivita rosea]|uniref:isopenicillin N synthase family oxygenase n=1 Tax=Pseudaestuariivita rosea TaxID=2763263 RepID=UPI001ABB2B40|nr:isopenicillin N synthase family oxygenase [Pseudaestuariivita rosea]
MLDVSQTLHTNEAASHLSKKDGFSITRSELDHLMENYGLFAATQNYVSAEELYRGFDVSRQFFALPYEEKKKCSAELRKDVEYDYVGYHHFKSETAVDADQPDLKEFIQISSFPGLRSGGGRIFDPFPYPADIPDMGPVLEALYRGYLGCADAVLYRVLDLFGIPDDQARDLVENCMSTLRIIHYPPVDSDDARNAQRAAPHTGINLIGVQPKQTHRGLQYIMPTDQSWKWLEHSSDTDVAINVGELLQYITGDALMASKHQVVNDLDISGKESRYCIVFFKNPNPDVDMPSLKYPTRNIGEWFQERMKEIGSWKQ